MESKARISPSHRQGWKIHARSVPLFGDKVGLDSTDAIELIILMERNFDVTLEDPKQGPKVFYSIRTMSEYINNQINAASKDSMVV